MSEPSGYDIYGNPIYGDVFVNDDDIVPLCDICGRPQMRVGDDWNGETGSHLSCEKKDELISELAHLISGLHVPISLHMELGEARYAYTRVRDLLNDFGWSSTEEVKAQIKRVLEV